MRTIYFGTDFKCHIADDGTMTAVETKFFDGKCDTYVEGFCYYPSGTILEGEVCDGDMITAWKDFEELDDAQREYERQLLAEYETALSNSVPISDLDAAYQEGVNAAYDQ